MTRTLNTFLLTSVAALSVLILVERRQIAMAQPLPALELRASDAAADEGAEALLRGPLHEAFAGPISLDPQSAAIVPKMPPEPIEEIPPEAKPEGENVIWIDGYWAWDEEREDFIYVSGVWRVPPQDRRWVPGYWAQAEGGYQWISGFWEALENEEIRYLPAPPTTLEAGPTSPQPSVNHYWISGCWLYRDVGYAWRPGYWNVYQEGWVWIPAHYTWTPRGAVFVGGYWDYPLARRGVVFAPVGFHRPVYLRSGYYYSPSVVVDISRLALHLFVHPRRCHYYWGDYYGYRPRGGHPFHPWHSYHGRHGYDPVFAYYSANYRRQNIDYAQRLRGWHDYYDRHEHYRPARTLEAQAQMSSRVRDRDPHMKYAMLGNTMSQALSRNDAALRLERISDTNRRDWKGLSSQMHEVSRQRGELESGPRTRPGTVGPPRTEADTRPELGRPDTRLRLPELPEIAKVKGPPGAPRRMEDSARADVSGAARDSRGSDWRDRQDAGRVRQPDIRPPTPDRSRVETPGPQTGSDAGRVRQPEIRPPTPDRSRVETPGPQTGSDAGRIRQPDIRPPTPDRSRIDIPGPQTGSDAGRIRQPDIRPPTPDRSRIETPRPQTGSDAGRVQRPDIRPPTPDRSRIEVPGPRTGSDAGRVQQPAIRPPTPDRSRIDIPGPRTGSDAGRVQQPAIRPPTPDRSRIEVPARSTSRIEMSRPPQTVDRMPSVQSPRVQSPSVQGPRVQSPSVQGPRVQSPSVQGPRGQSPSVQSPRVEIPRSVARPSFESLRQSPQGDRSRSSGSDRSAGRPQVSSPQGGSRPSFSSPSRGADRSRGGGGDRSRGR